MTTTTDIRDITPLPTEADKLAYRTWYEALVQRGDAGVLPAYLRAASRNSHGEVARFHNSWTPNELAEWVASEVGENLGREAREAGERGDVGALTNAIIGAKLHLSPAEALARR